MYNEYKMKLSTKSEYACLAIIDLAEHQNKYIRIEDIAKRKNIPLKYLEYILLKLKNSGYLETKRGVNGGCKLAKSPKEISIAEIIRLMDGALAPVKSASKYFYKKTPLEKSKKMINLMKEIRNYISNKLENTCFNRMTKRH
jgi:Rrf2 family protein